MTEPDQAVDDAEPAKPEVSVIIPVYNDAERLRQCLVSLSAQTYDKPFEVIVVDNGSDEPPSEMLSEFPFAQLAHESKPGSYAARNRGLELARGDVIAFTDADCLPKPNWLVEGISALEKQGDGLVGGRIEVFPADPKRPTSAELYDIVFGLNQQSIIEKFHGAATANTLTYLRVFDQVGPFNCVLKGGADVLWGQTVCESGKPVGWAEKAVVRHPARRTLGQLLVQHRRRAGGRVDKRREKRRRFFALWDVLVVLRLLAPPVERTPHIARTLRQRGYGYRYVVLVLAIGWWLRLVALWTGVTAYLGRATERR